MERDHDFTQGEIVPQLVGFALPVLPALFLQTMYGAVGLMVVGRFGGEPANVYVSAVSTGSQIMQTVTVAITGLAMGLTVYVARSIGAFGVRLPVSWLMSRQVPVSLFPIGLATPASSMIQIILCIGWYLVTLRKYGRIPDKF